MAALGNAAHSKSDTRPQSSAGSEDPAPVVVKKRGVGRPPSKKNKEKALDAVAAAPATASVAAPDATASSSSSASPSSVEKPKARARKAKGVHGQKTSNEKFMCGISRPAAKRMFKHVKGHQGKRLSQRTTAAIDKFIECAIRDLAHHMCDRVLAAQRSTIHLSDLKYAANICFPSSRVFL